VVKVKVTKDFTDSATPKKDLRKVNDVLEVDKERADHLVKEGVAEIVKETKGKEA